jgi:hypothetical protein
MTMWLDWFKVHPDVREDIGEFKTGVVRLQTARKNEVLVATRLHDEGIAHTNAGIVPAYKGKYS